MTCFQGQQHGGGKAPPKNQDMAAVLPKRKRTGSASVKQSALRANSSAIYYKKTRNRGYSLFANKRFARGEVVLQDPCVLISRKDHNLIGITSLGCYCFDHYGTCFIPMGYASLINHSSNPNTTWSFSKTKRLVTFKALHDIAPGEEFSHDYRWGEYPWEE